VNGPVTASLAWHGISGRVDLAGAYEIVVERVGEAGLIDTEDDVYSGRVHVEIDDRDSLALSGREHGEVGRRIGLAGAAAEGVHRDDLLHQGSRLTLEFG
jgi:hypothetical protein